MSYNEEGGDDRYSLELTVRVGLDQPLGLLGPLRLRLAADRALVRVGLVVVDVLQQAAEVEAVAALGREQRAPQRQLVQADDALGASSITASGTFLALSAVGAGSADAGATGAGLGVLFAYAARCSGRCRASTSLQRRTRTAIVEQLYRHTGLLALCGKNRIQSGTESGLAEKLKHDVSEVVDYAENAFCKCVTANCPT